jgi:peptide/nickel transport system ATP-binding protein
MTAVQPRFVERGFAERAPVLLELQALHTQLQTRSGTVVAVHGVDLVIRRGEVVALVGESGSGKSMTALSIMRLLPPGARMSAKKLTLGDLDLLALSDTQLDRIRGRRIAMLFQQPKATLDPTSRIGDQVAEALRLHRGLSHAEAWVRSVELLAKVGIPDPERRARAYAHQMSGGMAQRVMIAAALSGEPDLLIADEPTTALDVTVQAQILKLLATMRRESGLALLLITHDLGIVAAVADRVAVMYAGRIVEEGDVRTVLESPRHPYTRALLHSSLLTADANGRLYAIPGVPATGGSRDAGCRFRERCHLADDLGISAHCAAEEPPLVSDHEQHSTRCWGVPNEAAR